MWSVQIFHSFLSFFFNSLVIPGLETKISEHSPSGQMTFKMHLPRSVFTRPVSSVKKNSLLLKAWKFTHNTLKQTLIPYKKETATHFPRANCQNYTLKGVRKSYFLHFVALSTMQCINNFLQVRHSCNNHFWSRSHFVCLRTCQKKTNQDWRRFQNGKLLKKFRYFQVETKSEKWL